MQGQFVTVLVAFTLLLNQNQADMLNTIEWKLNVTSSLTVVLAPALYKNKEKNTPQESTILK